MDKRRKKEYVVKMLKRGIIRDGGSVLRIEFNL